MSRKGAQRAERRQTRQQRLRDGRADNPSAARVRQVEARVLPQASADNSEQAVTEAPMHHDTPPQDDIIDVEADPQVEADGGTLARIEQAEPSAEPSFVERLVGSGRVEVDQDTGLARFAAKPGLLRPFARRAYQRDLALNSIRRGFDDLSDLMADIRDGLDASVERQGELLEQLQWLPTVARQNAESAERFEEQFKRNNDQLARSNEIAGENLRLQSDSVKTQAESVKALRDQIVGQRDQNTKLNDVLGKMTRDSRDSKREVDDMQTRLDKMRDSDQNIANNLGAVAGAIRVVSEQTATQGEVVAKLQAALDERTRRLAADADRRGRSQSLLLMVTLLLSILALLSVATVGLLYLRSEGVVSF